MNVDSPAKPISPLTAVDLFCGAGGASLGLRQAGFELLMAVDIHPMYGHTYSRNLGADHFVLKSVEDVESDEIFARTTRVSDGVDLLFAGLPCQGFSMMGRRAIWDERNGLYRHILRLAKEIQPKVVVIENVPGLLSLDNGAFINAIAAGLTDSGYNTSYQILLAAQYGTPQLRWRTFIIGWRSNVGTPASMGFPEPTHGTYELGVLSPNQRLTPQHMAGFVTCNEAIGDLPPLRSGQEVSVYSGPAISNYQVLMRKKLTNELYNHYAANLSAQNLRRIASLKPGEDWRNLPFELLPPGMQRALRKDHTRRYRRMTWDGIPRAVITRFRDPKSGEYTHPEQDRTLSVREAARIQGFPDWFEFEGDRASQYEQVGNAVPVQLARAVGMEISRYLSGVLVPDTMDDAGFMPSHLNLVSQSA